MPGGNHIVTLKELSLMMEKKKIVQLIGDIKSLREPLQGLSTFHKIKGKYLLITYPTELKNFGLFKSLFKTFQNLHKLTFHIIKSNL